MPFWASGGPVPDDVTLEDPVLVALRRRLPLDHDGLVGPAAGNNVLWRGRGGLFGEGNPGAKTNRSKSG